MKQLRYIICLYLCYAPSYALAGGDEVFYDKRQWIYPAYAYCLAFGMTVLVAMYIVSLMWKSKINGMIANLSSYLIRHPLLSIITSGILLAIPIGFIGDFSWEVFWYLSLLPGFGIMIVFPFFLTNRYVREWWLLSPALLKWLLMFFIASVISSLLFIFLTNCNLLPGIDTTYIEQLNSLHRGFYSPTHPYSFHMNFYSPTHPYDSMKDIWKFPLIITGETLIAVLLFWFGEVYRYLCKKLYTIRHRRTHSY